MSIVIISGVWRSGTTMLATVLEGHSEILVEKRVQSFRWITNLGHHHRLRKQDVNLDKETAIHSLLTMRKDGNEDPIMRSDLYDDNLSIRGYIEKCIAEHLRQHGKKIWVDKAPIMEHYFEHLYQYIPSAKVIHIVRDGRSVAASRKIRKKNGIKVPAQEWVDSNAYALVNRDLVSDSQMLIIQYESLLRDPKEVVKRVCEFLNIDYQSSMLNLKAAVGELKNSYIKNHFDTSKIDQWKDQLTAAEIRKVESIQGQYLTRFGYELVNAEMQKEAMPLTTSQYTRAKLWNSFKLIFVRESEGMSGRQTSTVRYSTRTRLSNFLREFTHAILSKEIYWSKYVKSPKIRKK